MAERAGALAARSQDPRVRIAAAIVTARAAPSIAPALRSLEAARAEARKFGLRGLELEARLATSKIDRGWASWPP